MMYKIQLEAKRCGPLNAMKRLECGHIADAANTCTHHHHDHLHLESLGPTGGPQTINTVILREIMVNASTPANSLSL